MSLLRDRFAGRIPPALFVLAVAVVVLALPASVVAGGGGTNQPQTTIKTASDAAMDKLHSTLEHKVESGSTADVNVFVTMKGSAADVRGLLDGDRVAKVGAVSIVVGQTSVQALPKLAALKGVVSVGPIDLRKTGSPLGSPDPELAMSHNEEQINAALAGLYKREVPFSKARKLKGSNFDDLKKLAVLDAKTHDFARAWKDGFTGEGVTVGVMDGGTDFGHPDLIGTWQTWSRRTRCRLERLAEGVRPVRHRAVDLRAESDQRRAQLVHADVDLGPAR